MKLAIVLLPAVLVWSSASAEMFDLRKPEQKLIRSIVESTGANCPIPLREGEFSEDIRGKISKVDCSSTDGSQKWSIRLILTTGKRIVEPW